MSELWQSKAVLHLSPSSVRQNYDKEVIEKPFQVDLLHVEKKKRKKDAPSPPEKKQMNTQPKCSFDVKHQTSLRSHSSSYTFMSGHVRLEPTQ